MDELGDDSVHLVLTSPPYWTLKEYRDSEGQMGHIDSYDEFLNELDVSLDTAGGLDDALVRILQQFSADSGTIHMLGADGALHLRAASAGIPEFVLDIVRTVPVGKGMAGLAVERKQAVQACNLQTDTTGDVRPGARATGLQGSIVVPI